MAVPNKMYELSQFSYTRGGVDFCTPNTPRTSWFQLAWGHLKVDQLVLASIFLGK